ncbi:MAG: MFS transporter [Candidatus Helarchaeota archaeon]
MVIYTKKSKIIFFLIFFVMLNIIYLEIGFFQNIYKIVYIRFNLPLAFGNNVIGWILFGNYAVIGISTVIFGYYADKLNRMKLLVVGILIWSILCFLCFISQDFISFMVFRVLLGVGEGALMPISFSLLMDLIKFDSRSKLFALIGILNFLGPLIGIMIRGSVDAFTWQSVYLALAILGFINCSILYFMKEPERAATEEQFQELIKEGISYSYRIKKEDLKNIKERPTNFWLIINFVDTIVPGLIFGWLLYYIDEFNIIDFENFDLAQLLVVWPVLVALLIAVVGALVGTFYFAYIGDKKVNENRTIRAKIATWCSIITIPFTVAAFFPGIAFLSIPFGILIGIGLFWEQGIGSNWYATIMDLNFPENRGTMIALATLVDTFGRGIGGLIGGYIPYSMWFWTILIIQLLNMVLWLPVLKYISPDIKKIKSLMDERAKQLKTAANS